MVPDKIKVPSPILTKLVFVPEIIPDTVVISKPLNILNVRVFVPVPIISPEMVFIWKELVNVEIVTEACKLISLVTSNPVSRTKALLAVPAIVRLPVPRVPGAFKLNVPLKMVVPPE